MAYTNAWDETTPLGTEDAATADDYLTKHRLDLGERLEEMFYGFNAASNAAPENTVGIKNLKLYKQTADPTQVTDYAHVYVKLVEGVPELFYQDDENTTKQLTSGGQLNVVDADGAVVKTGAQTIAGVKTFSSFPVTPSSIPTADYQVANLKSIIGDDPTTKDSESNAMLKAHAYLTQTAGFVTAYNTAVGNGILTGYVDTDSNPVSGGTKMGQSATDAKQPFIGFFVGNGKYFEITDTQSVAGLTITWTPYVSGGGAPVDQD